MGIADADAADEGRDRVVDGLLLDAIELQAFMVDDKAQPLGGRVDRVVDVDDEIDLLERLAQLRRRASRRASALGP